MGEDFCNDKLGCVKVSGGRTYTKGRNSTTE